MKATVRSMTDKFSEYCINNIIGVQFIAGTLILTYMKDGNAKTTSYSSDDVIIEMH